MSDDLDSNELLRAYATRQDEAAFSQLVRRHVDLVFSTARRQLSGDADAARDVSQAVFCDLAGKARDIPRDIPIAGWLYRHTSYLASNHSRSSRRRDQRERQAALMQDLHRPTELNWNEVAPVLDEAMQSLPEEDRDALVLRFFENRKLREVGHALGATEEAARKRVDRALEKLRGELQSRGVVSTAAALGPMVSGNAVMPAPAGLASWITQSIATPSPVTSGGIPTIPGTLSTPGWLAVTTAIAVVLSTAGYQAHRTNQAIIQQLRAELASLSEQLAQANVPAPKPSTDLPDSVRAELAGLRGEVARLRRQTAASSTAAKPSPAHPPAEQPPAPAQIVVESKWILLSAELLAEHDLERQLPNEQPTHMAAAQVQALIKSLQTDAGTTLLSAPKVTTLSQRQAQISVTDITQENGRRFASGPLLDVTPTLATDGSIDLEFFTQWQVREPLPEPSDKPLTLPLLPAKLTMTKARLAADEFIAIRRAVPDGALDWAQRANPDLPDGDSNPSLIVLISAQEVDAAGQRIVRK